jgi:SSU ribosomal protein S14P
MMTNTSDGAEGDDEPTGQTHVCRATGREQGLVGTYDIWLSRQAFREMAHDMGFRKYE